VKLSKFFAAILLLAVFLAAVIFGNARIYSFGEKFNRVLASVFFTDSVSVEELRMKYISAPFSGNRVKILIVPGHEPNFGGAEYNQLKERDLNLELSQLLAVYLKVDPRFEVIQARDDAGWNSMLTSYFEKNWGSAKKFRDTKRLEMGRLIDVGKVVRISDGVSHSKAPSEVAIRLYAINMWANENDVDVTIHVHLNDYPRRYQKRPGTFSGFSIYIPDSQYSNAKASRAVAESVFSRIAEVTSVSNLPKEDAGIIGDQDLIAVGGQNTSDGVSTLIEYGYIYEPNLQNLEIREITFNSLAKQTSIGLNNFFVGASKVR